MPKASDEPLHKHTLNLYAGDFERLAALLPDVKPSDLVRKLVRDFINKHESAAATPADLRVEVEL